MDAQCDLRPIRRRNYILQSGLAVFLLGLILVGLEHTATSVVLEVIGATSLASSIYIVFATPKNPNGRAYRLIGSYLVASAVGVTLHYAVDALYLSTDILPLTGLNEIFGALAMGFVIVGMATLGLEHPPAAGLAVGLVIEEWTYPSLIVILVAALMLSILRRVLRPWLVDLR